MAGDCYWNGWTFSFAPADTFGPIEVKNTGDIWYVERLKNGRNKCLCLDGSWGFGDYFKSRREAEVAAVLAGMPSPDKKRADAAEARTKMYQDRCDSKQKIIDELRAELAETKKSRESFMDANATIAKTNELLLSQRDELRAEVAKLKGDLAQHSDAPERLSQCRKVAQGHECSYAGESAALDAVRKLRADYEKLVAKENEPRADYASMYTSACKRIDELRADYATAVASGNRFACDLAEERRRSVKVQVGGKEYLLRRGDELTHDFKVKA